MKYYLIKVDNNNDYHYGPEHYKGDKVEKLSINDVFGNDPEKKQTKFVELTEEEIRKLIEDQQELGPYDIENEEPTFVDSKLGEKLRRIL